VSTTTTARLPPPADFSVVLGGPLYQLLRRTRLSDDTLALVHRRILAFLMLTWVPLLLLSLLEGRAWWGTVAVPFLLNAEVQGRFLLAMPLLIMAELGVHLRMRKLVAHFFDRELIAPEDLPRMQAAVDSALRLRNSLAGELVLIVLIYAVGVPMREYLAVDARTWASGSSVRLGLVDLSLAGWWHALVSVPVFQFLLVRWYFRVFIWARFLWQVSRIDLKLVPAHPDSVGGLGFLANVVYAFAPILLAHGVLLAGLIADRIFYDGAQLPQFIVEIAGGVGVLVFVVLFPLMVFAGQLANAKRQGLGEYGVLAQRYVREFDAKWLRGGADAAEPLVGSADIQSLADLSNSFQVIRGMRFVPFSKETIMQLAMITVAPIVPLLLTMVSFEELLKRLLSTLF
jgi:hypothetical protein